MTRLLIAKFIIVLCISGCQSSAKIDTKIHENSAIERNLDKFVASNPVSREAGRSIPKKFSHSSTLDSPKIESLIGKSFNHIKLLFGEPDFQRIDEPSQLWQYRRKACRIYLFFYPDENGMMTVNFFDIRKIGSKNTRSQECFAESIKDKTTAKYIR